MSIQLNKSPDNQCIAYIKDKAKNVIVQKIFMTSMFDGKESISKKNPNFEVENNIFELHDTDKYELELSPETEKEMTNRIVLIGQSGSGKTYYLAHYLDNFRKKFFKHSMFLFSRHKKDPSIDWVPGLKRVEITESEVVQSIKDQKPLLEIEHLRNSICIFDDVFGSSNVLNKYYVNLLNDLETNSRKYSIHLCVVIHNSDYSRTRFILSESNIFVFMLNSSRAMNKRLMSTYLGLNQQQIDHLLNLKSRYLVIKNHAPLFYMTSKYIFSENSIFDIPTSD